MAIEIANQVEPIEFLNIKQVAELLGVKNNTISCWVTRGVLPPSTYVSLSKRHKLFIRKNLLEHIMSKGTS